MKEKQSDTKLGRRMKLYMNVQKFNVDDLAEAARLSRQTIYNAMSGKKTPGSDTLQSIAEALGVSVGALLD